MIPLGVLASGYVAPAGVPNYYSAVMTDSPIIYYPLGDSSSPVVDEIGNTTASSTSWPTLGGAGLGDASTSADFTPDNFINLTIPSALTSLSAITMEALISADTITGDDRRIVDRDSSPRYWQFRVNAAGKLELIRILGSIKSVSSTSTLSTSTTYHVAGVYDGTNLRVYVNGSLDCTPTACTGAITDTGTAAPISIGRRANPNDDAFDGRIAGVAIYSSALSSTRILAHAQAAGVA